MAPKKARKEAKEGREGKESNHNRKEEGNCADIWEFWKGWDLVTQKQVLVGYRLSQGEKGHQRAREPTVVSGRHSLGVSERIIGISIISYGKNSLDLRPTWVTTSSRERIEFVSQGPTVLQNCAFVGVTRVLKYRDARYERCRHYKTVWGKPVSSYYRMQNGNSPPVGAISRSIVILTRQVEASCGPATNLNSISRVVLPMCWKLT